MKKIFIFRFLVSICFFCCAGAAQAVTYASMSPVPTEIIYALNAEENLLGVSSACNYPSQAKDKPIIGDTYFVNMELLIKLKPDYLFAMNSTQAQLGALSMTKTKPVYFEFKNIEEIYDGIRKIAKLTHTEKNASKLIQNIQENIAENKTSTPKKILYIIQLNPLITIGSESFITDIIKKSGHSSVTESIPQYYPSISTEFAIKSNPDVVVVSFPSDHKRLQKLFPNSNILYLSDAQRDIINRSGPRIYEAVKLFAELDFAENPF